MAENISALSAEFGHASAFMPRTLHAPDPHELRRMLAELPDFLGRTVALNYRLSSDQAIEDTWETPDSPTSSMAVATLGPSPNLSNFGTPHTISYEPSLASSDSAKSASSVRTSRADSVLEPRLLEDDGNGVLLDPSAPVFEARLACIVHFLGCDERFQDVEEWDTHCRSELHNNLPRNVACPFDCSWKHSADSGEIAWRLRNAHIHQWHAEGEVDTEKAPDKSLLLFLWRIDVISREEYKQLQMPKELPEQNAWTSPSGPERDRRDRRRNRSHAGW